MLRACLPASAPSASSHVADGLNAALPQERRDRNAGPFAAAGQTVHALHVGIGRSATPFAAAVARALEKVNPRDRRHPSQLVDGEDERAIDQTMNRQRMRRRIDDRHARVMPLEVERRGRDDPVGVVQRRPARRFFERDLGVLIEKAAVFS